MILVTVGTHDQPFDRLVAAAERLAREGRDVFVQRGPSRVAVPHCTSEPFVTPQRLDALVAEATAVVTHAGPGSVLMALAAGHKPIVVPRRAVFGEHVDDHQVRFAARIAGRVTVVDDPDGLEQALQSTPRPGSGQDVSSEQEHASRQFADGLEALIQDVIARRPSRRDRLRRALQQVLRRAR